MANFRDLIDQEISVNVIELKKLNNKQFVQESMNDDSKLFLSFRKSVIKKRIKYLMLLKAFYQL